jgi:hypothetical protein
LFHAGLPQAVQRKLPLGPSDALSRPDSAIDAHQHDFENREEKN